MAMVAPRPSQVTWTEFTSDDPAELRDVINRGSGSRLQLAVPRRAHWRATVSQADAGQFTSTGTTLPGDLTFTNDATTRASSSTRCWTAASASTAARPFRATSPVTRSWAPPPLALHGPVR
ncbi:MAG TPA: hypothetical protein VGD68_14580 [Streptosporangiaceae bacterium]